MRRDDKAITDLKKILEVLTSEKICRIALTDGNTPYIIPLNYGYKENTLYIHSAPQGRKIDIIKKNNRVCFEIERDVQIIPAESACKWATRYTSIIGYGRAEILSGQKAVTEALDIIMKQQSGRDGFSYSEEHLKKIVIIRIEIDSMTGKRSE